MFTQMFTAGSPCLLCGAASLGSSALCQGCLGDLGLGGSACRRCAIALPVTGLCPVCQRRPPPFEAAWAAMPFQPLTRELVHQLKYQGRLASATVLGELLAMRLRQRDEPWPDLMIPVPLHPRRLRSRGFNQAAELARVLAARIPVRMDTFVCQRVRDTMPQARLGDARERRRNLRQAFRIGRELPGSSVAIVDDVVTTGATVTELASELRRAGAGRVEVWCVCRANR